MAGELEDLEASSQPKGNELENISDPDNEYSECGTRLRGQERGLLY